MALSAAANCAGKRVSKSNHHQCEHTIWPLISIPNKVVTIGGVQNTSRNQALVPEVVQQPICYGGDTGTINGVS